jgi:hypothetical protein
MTEDFESINSMFDSQLSPNKELKPQLRIRRTQRMVTKSSQWLQLMQRRQNFVWPSQPRFANPVNAVMTINGTCEFNFMLVSGESTDLGQYQQKTNFDPTWVRTVVFWYSTEDARLRGL